eukprot:TRINITY_DN7497_c0_g1_i1.p1 TRINITY_DN7497_c0_g1~~TRINITY_DN7497_c0_g1_i1.p1  ORF type:complete len:560 (-),score=151.76 TRINITY_DN7497_c0_g1_i1:138-1766(-)
MTTSGADSSGKAKGKKKRAQATKEERDEQPPKKLAANKKRPRDNGDDEADSSDPWAACGLCPELCRTVVECGYSAPTGIQAESLPHALGGRDVVGIAETGSGKTAAFTLPVLQQLLETKAKDPRAQQATTALILCPTRELALQVAEHVQRLGKSIGVKTCCVMGGQDITEEALQLSRKPHVIVATPGRIKDHLETTKGFHLNKLKFLVMDEADKMLDLNFEKDLDAILSMLPSDRQTQLFSATMTSRVEKLKRAALKDPVRAEVANKDALTVRTLDQRYVFVPHATKLAFLVQLLDKLLVGASNGTGTIRSVIVFVESGVWVEKVTRTLRQLNIRALPLRGAMEQDKRLASLDRYRTGEVRVLIATNLASRGLDIPHVDCVLLYDTPLSTKDYIHRVGRTARAGRSGLAITFVTQYDILTFQKLEQNLGLKMEEYPTDEAAATRDMPRIVCALKEASREISEMEELKKLKKRRRAGEGEAGGGAEGDGGRLEEGHTSLQQRRAANRKLYEEDADGGGGKDQRDKLGLRRSKQSSAQIRKRQR